MANNFVRPEKKFTAYDPISFKNTKYLYRSFNEAEEDWRNYLSLWKSYPDFFIDFISNEYTKIKLFPYQRLMLRVFFRYQYVFCSMARGSAKSYTEVLSFYLKCMFFPSCVNVMTSAIKEQSAKISKQNIEKIWEHFPMLKGELTKWTFQRDSTILYFKNNSVLRIVQMAEADRGGR